VTSSGELHLFAKECNAVNVRFLYRDDPRVRVVPLPLSRDSPVGEHALVRAYVAAHGASRDEYVRIGFEAMSAIHTKFGQEISCDQSFYVQSGLPYELRFTGFHLKREMELEEQAYRRFNPSDQPYSFVDADPARGMVIPSLDAAIMAGAAPGLRRVFNDPTIPLLQMGLILERAQEIHVCESAIRCLLEGIAVFRLRTRALFLHAYRGRIWGANTALRWTQVGLGKGDVTRPEPFHQDQAQRSLLDRATRWAGTSWHCELLRCALSHPIREPQ